MWIIDDPIDPWHYELIRMGFNFRWGYPGELCPNGQPCQRFYWRNSSPRGTLALSIPPKSATPVSRAD